MTDDRPEAEPDPEFASPVESALHEKLEPVRAEPPVPSAEIAKRVGTTLRWQALVVLPLTAAAAFAGGVITAIRVLGRSRTS